MTDAFRIWKALVREMRVWEDLKHKNILPLRGFCLRDDHSLAWLISPWEEQGNLSGYLKKDEPSQRIRLRLVSEIFSLCMKPNFGCVKALDTAEGLAYLHARDPPVCHGDIKPVSSSVGAVGGSFIHSPVRRM